MKKKSEAIYNERLFTRGVRGRLHAARFEWLAKSLQRLECDYDSVLELGCYDGKVIDHLPARPARYLGLDANWEGGLDIARDRWKDESTFDFRFCTTPQEMGIDGEKYDIALCMETLEHVPPELVSPYLEKLAAATRQYLFVTAPNEIGAVFFFKELTKSVLGADTHGYTMKEFMHETLGNTDRVERNNHKGFNYKDLVRSVSAYFDILEVSGHPLSFAPASLNFGVGIIGKPREQTIPSPVQVVS